MADPVRPTFVARVGRRLEAWVGLVTAVVVGVLVVTIGAFPMVPAGHRADPYFRWELAGLLVATVAEGVFICVASDALRHGRYEPFAPAFALRTRGMPLLLRPVAAAWWLAHFAAGVLLAFGIELGLAMADARSHAFGRYGWAVQFAAFVGIGFTLAFAFNLYAMLALAAVGFGERFVYRAWRWRVTIDLALALTAAVVATRVHPTRVVPRTIVSHTAGVTDDAGPSRPPSGPFSPGRVAPGFRDNATGRSPRESWAAAA